MERLNLKYHAFRSLYIYQQHLKLIPIDIIIGCFGDRQLVHNETRTVSQIKKNTACTAQIIISL